MVVLITLTSINIFPSLISSIPFRLISIKKTSQSQDQRYILEIVEFS